MQVTRIEISHLEEHPTLLFACVQTSEGLIGYGETEYAIDPLHGVVHRYAALLPLGKTPFQIDRHWRMIYENADRCGAKGVEMRALSALGFALWDILDQAAGKLRYQLLGGASHDRMPVYNTCAGPVYARALDRSKGIGDGGKLEDLDAFMHRADEFSKMRTWSSPSPSRPRWRPMLPAFASSTHRSSSVIATTGVDCVPSPISVASAKPSASA